LKLIAWLLCTSRRASPGPRVAASPRATEMRRRRPRAGPAGRLQVSDGEQRSRRCRCCDLLHSMRWSYDPSYQHRRGDSRHSPTRYNLAPKPRLQPVDATPLQWHLSQGVRRFDLRWSRSIGLARTHLQRPSSRAWRSWGSCRLGRFLKLEIWVPSFEHGGQLADERVGAESPVYERQDAGLRSGGPRIEPAQ
jgi:hypothetical protein